MALPLRGRTTVLGRPVYFLLCAAVALPTAAQEPALLEEIVVRAARLTADGTVIQTRVLPENASDTLPLLPADLLRAVPGAFVQQTTPGQGIPILRGLKGSQVLHLVDGFRLNNAFFRSAPNQYLALVPAESVSAIEVARGPVGTAFGSDAMGGVVQLRSAQPTYEQPLQFGGRLGYIGSSEALTAALRMRGGSVAHAFEAGVSGADVGDRRTAAGTVSPSAYESRAAWLSSRHRWAGAEWLVTAQVLEQPDTPRVDELVPGFGRDTPAASEFFFEPNRREFLQLTALPHVDAPWADELRVQFGWQRIVDDRRIRPYESDLRTRERNSSELLGMSLTASRRFDAARELRYGLDLSTDEVRSRRVLENIEGDLQTAVAARYPDGSRIDSLGMFADYHWQVAPGTGLELGLRYSRFHIDLAATEFGDTAARLEPDDITARLGLRQRLTETVDFVANLAQGFRAPNIFDLGAVGPRPGNRFNVANPALEPERINSLDAGLVGNTGTLRWEATAFYADYRDRISSVLTGEVTEDGRLVTRSENIASAELYGAELFAAWQGPRGWTLDGTLNWTWGEEEREGVTMPADRIPPLNGRLRLDAPFGSWRVGAVLAFAAAQERLSPRDELDPRMDPQGTGGWTALNLRARRSLGERLVLTVGVDNVLDAQYREHGSGIDAPGRGIVVELAAPLGGS
jgi:outer membrane receptor protein involved in Fe transport